VDIDTAFNMDGYNLFYPDNMKRGVLTYVKNNIPVQKIEPTIICEESVWCQIQQKNAPPLVVGNVYRSPSSTQDNNAQLFRMIEEMSRAKQVVLCGDFNFKEIDWRRMVVAGNEAHPASLFVACLEDNFLTQHVEECTRKREGQDESLLDLVISSDDDQVMNLEYWAPIGKSDHVVLCYNVRRGDVEVYKEKKGRNYYKGDYVEMRREISMVDWEDVFMNLDVEEAWQTLEDVLSTNIERYVPESNQNSTRRKKWVNRESESVVKEKHKAHQKYMNNKTQENWNAYKTARNKATVMSRKARSEFELKLVSDFKDNPKPFWGYVKSQGKVKKGIAPLLKNDGTIATEAEDKANTLNSFFAGVFTRERSEDIPEMEPVPLVSTLSSLDISEDKVLSELDELKAGKSAGPDGIHPRVLIEIKHEIKKPLFLVFKKSLEEGRIPNSWKSAEVVPIYKKGSRQEAGNYRPVSLTSVCSKILERLIRAEVLRHMEENHLFVTEQHGFRPRRSCITQLLTVLETWTKWLDEGTAVDCIYLDYKKAFDSVPHERLLLKLQNLGIRGNVLQWMRSFLTGRQQRVRVENALSDWSPVTSGIPQGSVLGPTLFLCFVNDLPQQVTSQLALFADDTKVFGPVRDENDAKKLRDDLECLHQWSYNWQLPFNKEKCKVVHYGRNNQDADYSIDGTVIEDVEVEKDLGVLFDSKLNFSGHVQTACKKANSRVGIVKRTFMELPPKPATTLFKSLVRPIVEYAQTVAHPLYKKEEDCLEKVQRRATKQIKGMKEKTYEERLKELKLPTLKYRRRRADMLQTFRIMHGVDDIEPERIFQRDREGRTRGHSMKLKKARVRTSGRTKTFSQRVVDSWNALPEEVVSSKDVNTFKNRLEKCWKRDPGKYLYDA